MPSCDKWANMRMLIVLLSLFISSSAVATQEQVRTTVVILKAMSLKRAELLYDKAVGRSAKTQIVVDRRGRSLVVRDYRSKLEQYKALIGVLDAPGTKKLKIYVRPVVHLKASVLADKLKPLMKAVSRAPLRMAPMDRARRLVVMTTWPVYRKLDVLARRLDVRVRR